MTKLIYPDDGIHEYCQSNIEEAKNKMESAYSGASFDIPSDFSYINYLGNLQNTLKGYHQEITNIESKIKSTDASFAEIAEELGLETNKMIFSSIKERDRMIK